MSVLPTHENGHPRYEQQVIDICQTCGSLVRERPSIASDREPHPPTVEQLNQSGKNGCSICSTLAEICLFLGYSDEKYVRVIIPKKGMAPEMAIEDSRTTDVVQLYTSEGYRPCWQRVPVRSELLRNRSPEHVISFVRECLQSCLDTHASCKLPNKKLPTRLVDIGEIDDGCIRLIKPDKNSSEPYIALSYCWGPNEPTIKLTAQTLESFEAGFDIQDLPVVFRECVMLSRSLGIRYIWIDALCIIQGDFKDWEKESSMMSQIYAHALLTIAASMSSSTSESFLRGATQAGKGLHFVKKVRWNGEEAELNARIIPEIGNHSRWAHRTERLLHPSEPWSKRGWTLQEQLLSRRLLLFTSTEIQWSCQEEQTCECQSPLNYQRLFGGKTLAKVSNASQAFDFWHKVVENYSIRSLKHPTDMLPALSGIAHIIQERSNSQYTAGVWNDNIAQDLLWHRAGDAGMQTDYLAPSFSWASITGEIDYLCVVNGRDPYTAVSKVVSIKADAQTSSFLLGAVRGGEMLIRGPLTPATISGKGLHGAYKVTLNSRSTFQFYADTILATPANNPEVDASEVAACRYRPESSDDTVKGERATNAEYKVTTGDDGTVQMLPNVRHGSRCWLLRLGCYGDRKRYQSFYHQFLILGKHPFLSEKFERLGIWVMKNHGSNELTDNPLVSTKEQVSEICIV